MTFIDDLRYRLGSSVLCRELDGDQLVYVGDRFDTHLLDLAAALVVASLLPPGASLTLAGLRQRLLGDEFNVDEDPDTTLADDEGLRALLKPLVRAGIVVEQIV